MSGEIVQTLGENDTVVILGIQLQKARKTVSLSPEEVAERLGIQSEAVLKWETEREIPSLDELERLADLYGREVGYFLRETPDPPAGIQLRSTVQGSLSVLTLKARRAIAGFDELCRASFEIEAVLHRAQPVRVAYASENVHPAELARRERENLGYGSRPVHNLRERLSKRGVRIFHLPVPARQFSGLSCWHENYGPCVLISAREQRGRRSFTLAHEYAHLLYRHAPSVCSIREERVSGPGAEERLADRFAVEFLLPLEHIREDFSMRNLTSRPSLQDMARMAGKWYTSIQAMLYRLEEAGLVDRRYAEQLLASYEPESYHFRTPKAPTFERRLGRQLVLNAVEAYRQGLISLGKLAYYLEVPVRKALQIGEEYGIRSK